MNALGHLVMFGWIPAIFYLFTLLPVQRAVVISFITAWLFLPVAGFALPGLPDYTKMSATCYGILLATTIFDADRLLLFRPRWIDLPMFIWCLCPAFSSLANDLGVYDAFSAALNQTVTWGIPYLLGRIYLNSFVGLRQVAVGIFIGGLVYVPLCLFEVRMSPQLHRIVYGFFPHSFAQTVRLGGYRPNVFMNHGLMVGMWMMAAALIGFWLLKAGTLRKVWGIALSWLVNGTLITFVLVKSTGAYFYFVIGISILYIARWARTALPLYLLIATMGIYLSMGVSGSITPAQREQIVNFNRDIAGEERAQSLETRLLNEEQLGERARERLLFGWGGWGRNRVINRETGRDQSITDSLWIITFGTTGLVGLISLTSVFLLPVVWFSQFRFPAQFWFHPKVAPIAVLAVVLSLYFLDCLFNAMVNPIFTVVAGGLSGFVVEDEILLLDDKSKQVPTLSRVDPLTQHRRDRQQRLAQRGLKL